MKSKLTNIAAYAIVALTFGLFIHACYGIGKYIGRLVREKSELCSAIGGVVLLLLIVVMYVFAVIWAFERTFNPQD